MSLTVDGHRVVPLTAETWPLFEGLAGHKGLFGSCWCVHFHCHPDRRPERQEMGNQAFKKKLVDEGIAHAALVLDGDEAVAWAEYGTVAELPNIHHRKQWEAETEQPPDYRVTCVFVDKGHRRTGLAETAVRGALALIAEAGGGRVESYPHDLPPEKKVSSSFLYNATRTMYERRGFSYVRPKGQGNCVMSLEVPAA
jgi:GNAT superfamily N-acetyltransferase